MGVVSCFCEECCGFVEAGWGVPGSGDEDELWLRGRHVVCIVLLWMNVVLTDKRSS